MVLSDVCLFSHSRVSSIGVDSDDLLEKIRNDINSDLRFMKLELRRIIFEQDGQVYWGLANNSANDHVIKLCPTFNPAQIKLYRALVSCALLFFTTCSMDASS